MPNADLSTAALAFLREPRFMSVASVDPDGAPRQVAVWYDLLPDGRILLNSRTPRRWCLNLMDRPAVALSIIDAEDGYRWLGLTGAVEETVADDVERARDDIVALAHRYHPEGPSERLIAEFRGQPRVTFIVRITGVHDHLED
ncbi:MAG TPA: pyridoxamine 5'-phosphate oxidase family protein [Candidatus Limnocylindrales bacterium]|nr:pyridoxamine 5'-phosphate oxidase family protein [Candidatus Limnocylindrales bacterium]